MLWLGIQVVHFLISGSDDALVVAAGANLVLITRGIDKTTRALVSELKAISKEAAVEEVIVVGGGCTLLRLASKVDAIKNSFDNDEEKVVKCCLEHAALVAKTFLMSDCVVVEIKEPEPVPAGNPMDNSRYGY
ncbi:hypothetical protein J1N35_010498 [Gossypium stocksii]|uniref:TCP-1/cpn60 chaperonin family protein n=1 Tax=Gossypium stocksii TaxID=47602 RepID=A0A9D3W2B1_9ROSI|nr:hypothetical protein J1N35_010498 [Gossypium stocksii]